MSPFRILLAAAAVLVAPLAHAADLPARYTVDEKQLKAALAGTNMTFSLYSDATCTALVSSTVIAIENVDLLGRIKPFNPKNAPKKKNTVEMRATLTGVPATPSLYLTVTGTGVTPVGGACQVQASGLSGGSGQLLVKDGNNATVGVYDGASGAIYDAGSTKIRLQFMQVTGFQQAFFFQTYQVANDCSGPQLLPYDPSLVRSGSVAGTTMYYPPASGVMNNTTSILYRNLFNPVVDQTSCDAQFGPGNSTFVAPDGCCQLFANTVDGGAATSVDLSAFVPPFSVQ
jgi:hypothetical protein